MRNRGLMVKRGLIGDRLGARHMVYGVSPVSERVRGGGGGGGGGGRGR